MENPNYEDVYLIARKNGQVGLIKNNKTIINFEFQSIEYDLGEELLKVEKNAKYGIYDLNGKIILKPIYDEVWIKGVCIYAKEGEKEEVYDLKGNKIENMKYLSINQTENSNYFITISEDGLCGLIDKNNKEIIKNEYTYLEYLFDNYFIASKKDNKFGIINEKEEIVVDYQYDILGKIGSNNIIQGKILDENILEIYNNKLKKVFSEPESTLYIKSNFIQIISKQKIDYFDLEGSHIKNSEIYINNDLLAIQKDGKWGFSDRTGNIKVECIYDEVTEFNEYGFAGIRQNKKWGVIDQNQNIIIEPTYELETDYIKPEFIGKYFKQYYDTGEVYYTDNI